MRSRGLIVAALFAAFSIAATGTATGGTQSSVAGSGTGHFAETGGPFSLSVSGRGEGQAAKGYVHGSGVYVDAFEVEGPITCMRVEGNLASVKYRFKRASGPGAPPQDGGVQVYIEDNGRPQNGQPVDRVATEPPQPPGAFDAAAGICTDPRLNPAWTRLESGDFTVRDAG